MHEPNQKTRTEVEAMASVGIQREEIAAYLDIDEKTLAAHYERELKVGPTKANSNIARRLYAQAMSGNTSSLIFWCKTRMGWSEKNIHEHLGPNGAPLLPSKIEIAIPVIGPDGRVVKGGEGGGNAAA